MEFFDIFLLEAVLNGLLLGGLLALLSLGLNLIFGVIDVVWISYAELMMVGMYAIYWSHTSLGLPLALCLLFGILGVAALGAAMHWFIIRPVLSAEPINQLLVTGGVLFFLQALATVSFGIDFKNIGVRLPTCLFLTRTFAGTAIRAISQDRSIMPLMGVNPERIYLLTSAMGGALAGLAACLLVLQYDIHPAIGLSFGPITFLVCVMGGLGNLLGGFVAAFIFAQLISVGGYVYAIEWGYVLAFVFFIAMMFIRPEGILFRRR